MLQIENLNKSFDAVRVLSDLNLSIEKRSITGLAGPSGGGKSTLLRCIQGLDQIDSGVIVLQCKSAFMFQDFQLFPHMNVLENLIYAPTIQDKTKDHKPRAMEILKSLGVAEKANIYPAHLSGGQKQRVALARSLMMRPELLLCDEPTSGLDVATIEEVVSLLKSVRDLGVTMIIASHDLDFLTKVANRIILIKEGVIVADIVPSETNKAVQILKKNY